MTLVRTSLLTAFTFFVTTIYGQSAMSLYSTAKKAYNSSNYFEASINAMDALRKKPTHKKAQELLSQSFEYALEDLFDKIAFDKDRSKVFVDDATVQTKRDIIESYRNIKKLNRKITEVNRLVKKSKFDIDFEVVNVSKELIQAQEELKKSINDAAEYHYQNGLSLFEKGGKDNSKRAAKEFKAASNYVTAYKDSDLKYSEAKEAGTIKLAIIDFENLSHNTTLGAVGASLTSKLVSKVVHDPQVGEFTKIITRSQLGTILDEHDLNASVFIKKGSTAKFGSIEGVDKIIVGSINQISVERTPIIVDGVRRTQKSVVVRKEKYLNERGKEKTRNIMGNVYANVTEYHKKSNAVISGSYQVLNIETGEIELTNDFTQNYDWSNDWRKYTGDIRAVPSVSGYDSSEKPYPTYVEMGSILVNGLSNSIAYEIQNYLR